MSAKIKNLNITGSLIEVDLEIPVVRLVPEYRLTFTTEDAARIGVSWESMVKVMSEVFREIEVKNEAINIQKNE